MPYEENNSITAKYVFILNQAKMVISNEIYI